MADHCQTRRVRAFPSSAETLRLAVFRNLRIARAMRENSPRKPLTLFNVGLGAGLYTCPMQTYLVGGAVRDSLLGLPVQDRDWVVVGATPEEMVAQGFLPVGKDFPVFLHPVTKEEYALARTERKTAPGYKGFVIHAAPDVTLEQDLARRDLTINSIAGHALQTRATGVFGTFLGEKQAFQPDLARLIDPHGGQQDLRNKVLRHVTDAFREDPVRILRVARFAARFADFSVAPETMQLMRDMVAHGEADHLVAERVWQELARGLMARKPSRMFEVLRECGALERLLPEVNKLWGVPQRADCHPEIDTIKLGSDSNFIAAHSAASMPGNWQMNLESDPNLILDMAARLDAPLPVRFACLCHNLGKDNLGSENLLKDVCQRLRVPTDCRELADVVAREHGNIQRSGSFNAVAVVRLLERCDAFRKPARFADVLLACECDAHGRQGLQETAYPQRQRLLGALAAAQSVATDSISSHALSTGATGIKIGEMIHAARVTAVAKHGMA